MLKSIGDWYRIQDPEPNDEVLRMRREASEALLSHFVRAQISTFLSLISCALEGLLGKQDGSEVPMSVLDEMAKAQPSLNRELIAETLDPRLCVAVALSEFIGREPANANEKSASYSRSLLLRALCASEGLEAARLRPGWLLNFSADQKR